MAAYEFDADSDVLAFNQSIGLGPATDPDDDAADTDITRTAQADAAALGDVARQPTQPLLINTPAGQPDPATPGVPAGAPDYLTPLYKGLADITPIEEPDYTALYREKLGVESLPEGEVADSDRYFADVTDRLAQQDYLNTVPNYRDYKALQTREYASDADRAKDDLMLIQNQVRGQLGDVYDEREFDHKMQFLVEEGELTETGQRLAEKLRGQISNYITQEEQNARTNGKEKGQQIVTRRNQYQRFVSDYKPMGLALDEADKPALSQFALSGELDKRLDNLTDEEVAIISVALNPALRNKYFALRHYEAGADTGARRKLGSRLN